MGACISSRTDGTTDGITPKFYVVNIDDDRRLGRKGLVLVTDSDLLYTDRKTQVT